MMFTGMSALSIFLHSSAYATLARVKLFSRHLVGGQFVPLCSKLGNEYQYDPLGDL